MIFTLSTVSEFFHHGSQSTKCDVTALQLFHTEKDRLNNFCNLFSRIHCSLQEIQSWGNTKRLNIHCRDFATVNINCLNIHVLVPIIKVTYLEKMIQNSSMLPKDRDLPKISLPHFGVKVCL